MLLALVLSLAAQAEPLKFRARADINFSGARAVVDGDPADGPVRPIPYEAFRYCEVANPSRARVSTISPASTLTADNFKTGTGENILTTTFDLFDDFSRAKLKVVCLRNAIPSRQVETLEDFRDALSSMFNMIDPTTKTAAKNQE